MASPQADLIPPEIEAIRLQHIENKRCFECHDAPALWASVTYGIFICLQCSGKHRSLGTHLSFVRSLSLDKWDDKQTAQMVLGGNHRAQKHFGSSYSSLQEKYSSREAANYAALLRREVYKSLGFELPPEQTKATEISPNLHRFKGAIRVKGLWKARSQ